MKENIIERPMRLDLVPRDAAPLAAIDQILRLDGAGVTTRRKIRDGDPFFEGHDPGFPIFPGVFIVESVNPAAQAYIDRFVGEARLVEARSRFLAAVRPGDVLECDCACRLVKRGARLSVDATCRKGGVVASSVRLTYQVGAGGGGRHPDGQLTCRRLRCS